MKIILKKTKTNIKNEIGITVVVKVEDFILVIIQMVVIRVVIVRVVIVQVVIEVVAAIAIVIVIKLLMNN